MFTKLSNPDPKRLNTQSAGPVHLLIFCSRSIFLLASIVAGRRPLCNAGAEQQGMYSTIPIHWNIKSAPASPGRSRVGPAVCVFSLLVRTTPTVQYCIYNLLGKNTADRTLDCVVRCFFTTLYVTKIQVSSQYWYYSDYCEEKKICELKEPIISMFYLTAALVYFYSCTRQRILRLKIEMSSLLLSHEYNNCSFFNARVLSMSQAYGQILPQKRFYW